MTAYEIMKAAQDAQATTTAPKPQPQAPVAPQPKPAPAKAIPASKPAPAKPIAPVVPPVQLPDINSRALLVTFSCPIPGNEKVDREVTQNVLRDQHMGSDAGKWDKKVFPPAIYKPLQQLAQAIRAWNYDNTLDWPTQGVQMIPLTNYHEYCQAMRGWRMAYEEARDKFMAKLPEIREWAKKEHNGSYDASLYDEYRIRSKFGFSVEFSPIPMCDHFTAQMRELLGADAEAINDRVANAVADAEKSLWNRLVEPLKNVVAILGKRDAGAERTRITDSLIDNVLSIAKLIPALNVNNDPELAAFAAEAEKAFANVTTKQLKEDDKARAAAIAASNDILRRVTGRKS